MFGVEQKMASRLLDRGESVTYDELRRKLQEGEVLVATWLRTPRNLPNARPVVDEGDLETIKRKTKYGYYVDLRWFASTTGSTDPDDYDMFD